MLVIEAIAVRGQPVGESLRATFGEGGGTIGRGSTSTLVLPDPERHISRTQATIEFQAGAYVITDTGTLNPLTVNGRALGGGVHSRLKDGDELAVGPYKLRVHVSGIAQPKPAPAAPVQSISGSTRDDPLSMFPGAASANPFDDLVPERAHAQPQSVMGEQPRPASANAGAGLIPDDFDIFATEPKPVRDDLMSAPQAQTGPQPLPPGEDIDKLFELPGGRIEPPLRGGLIDDGFSSGTANESDSMDLRFRPKDSQGSVADHLDEINEHYTPPPPLPDPRPVVPSPGNGAPTLNERAPVPPSAKLPKDAAELSAQLAEAFLAGAGVKDVKFPQGMTPEIMGIVGRVLRESVQGTLDLLNARAQVKNEIHASATVIVPRDNNPLKFSPNAEVALSHLLEPKGQGFMTPIRAMRDAFDDLRAHQIAVLSGMRAALTGVMQRFSPKRLETKLNDKSMLDSLLPMARKARQWDLFAELYREISAEAEEDYRVVFGKEFRRAYEAQLAKFRASDASAARR
jgi:predicted component of type VI protein secretion system